MCKYDMIQTFQQLFVLLFPLILINDCVFYKNENCVRRLQTEGRGTKKCLVISKSMAFLKEHTIIIRKPEGVPVSLKKNIDSMS